MKAVLASSLLALGLLAATPASAQRLEIGPDGPGIDMRTRRQRDRDLDRQDMRRDIDRGEVRRERGEMRRRPEIENNDDDED